MPKRRAHALGGAGAGGVSVAAAALAEARVQAGPESSGPRPARLPEGFAARTDTPLSAEESARYREMAARAAGGQLSPEEMGRYYEYMIRREALSFRRLESASVEERADARNRLHVLQQNLTSAALSPEDRELIEGRLGSALEREAEGGEVIYRPGFEDRLGRPLSRAEEVPRFSQLWDRWQRWERGEDVPRLAGEELGELAEYLERRMVLPLRRSGEGSLEDRRAALDQARARHGELTAFLQMTFPATWEGRLARHSEALARARHGVWQLENRGRLNELDGAARVLEERRRAAMAAASGETDVGSLERAYAAFSDARERAFSLRASLGEASLSGETERILRLAEAWEPRLAEELERRRRAGGAAAQE